MNSGQSPKGRILNGQVYRIVAVLLSLFALSHDCVRAETTPIFVIGDTGDCSDGPRQVSDALQRDPDYSRAWLLEVGDLAYPAGTKERLQECHEPFFGPQRFPKRFAVPGNHDARDVGLAGFRSLYPEALPRTVDFDRWRFLLIDSNLRDELWGRQVGWVEQTLKDSANRCVIAVWHHPAWSSGHRGGSAFARPLWAKLAGVATLTVHGHDHHYERLAPRDAQGAVSAEGTPSFIAGHGGASLYQPPEQLLAGGVTVFNRWGYLKLELTDTTYRWQAVSVTGEVQDEGRGVCRPVSSAKPF